MIKKKSLLNYCGLLGVAAFLSYTAAVVLLFIVSLVLIIIVGAKDKSAWNRTVSDEVLESEKYILVIDMYV